MSSLSGRSLEGEALSDLVHLDGRNSSKFHPSKKAEKRAVRERHTDLRHLDVDSRVRREFLAYKWELLRISKRRLDPRATFDTPAANFSSFGQVHADNRPTGDSIRLHDIVRYLAVILQRCGHMGPSGWDICMALSIFVPSMCTQPVLRNILVRVYKMRRGGRALRIGEGRGRVAQ